MNRIIRFALIAVLVAALTLQVSTMAYAHCSCDTVTAQEISDSPDEVRWAMYEEYSHVLPEPPAGYTWAEDLTLVPESFYG